MFAGKKAEVEEKDKAGEAGEDTERNHHQAPGGRRI